MSLTPDIVTSPLTKWLHAYKAQIEALLEGGVDLLLAETAFDNSRAKSSPARY